MNEDGEVLDEQADDVNETMGGAPEEAGAAPGEGGDPMAEGEDPEGQSDEAVIADIQEAGGIPDDLPPGLKQEIVDGTQVLFYTAVQVAMKPLAKKRIDPLLKRGKLFEASRYVMDQSIKNNRKEKVSAPMLIVGIYYVTEFVASLGRSMGYKLTQEDVREATLLNVDHFTGQMIHGKAADKMRKQKPKGPPVPVPPQGGQMPPMPPQPQGGMM